jgi:tetratricopeptide (TPR) repeat protein
MSCKLEPHIACVRHSLTYGLTCVIRAAAAILVVGLLATIATSNLLARGGGPVWGYSPHAGQSGTFGWGVGWGGINLRSIYGIPHHSLDAPNFTYGSGPTSSFNIGQHAAGIDRSVFAGGSSDTSVLLPNFNRPTPTAPYRTDRRMDPPYYHNYDSYWYHGYWGGGKWGWGNWGGAMGIWSFTRWSFGPVYYVSGYGQFRNPFLAGQKVPLKPFLDYGKPIENLPDDDEPAAKSASSEVDTGNTKDAAAESTEEILSYVVKSPEVKAGLKSFDAAANAFRKKDYNLALEKTDDALEQLPYDSAIHEFRALVLFAQGDYPQAAATIYAVLAVSPGWDWTTLSSRYDDQEEYARHLRQLEAFDKQNPDSAVAAFLRGYHYTTCRHTEAAAKYLQAAARLLPDDALIPRLATLIAGAAEKSPASSVPAAPAEVSSQPANDKAPNPNVPQITKAKLAGQWQAIRGGTTSITLTLRDNQQFKWAATRDGKTRLIAGPYAFEGNALFLYGGSGTLIGGLQPRPSGGFNFTLLDNAPDDPGLDFARK